MDGKSSSSFDQLMDIWVFPLLGGYHTAVGISACVLFGHVFCFLDHGPGSGTGTLYIRLSECPTVAALVYIPTSKA